MTTCLPALPVPVSWPATVVPAPKITGLGLALSVSPSGCFLVENERSPPLVTPSGLLATTR